MNDTKKQQIRDHAITQILNILIATPIIISAAIFTLKPHAKDFVLDIVRGESVVLRYEYVSDMLTILRNSPVRNDFNNSEIARLEELQKLLRQKMSVSHNSTHR